MDFRVSKARQVYHAECADGRPARDLVATSVMSGDIYKRGGGWSMGLLDHQWIRRFVSFRLVPIVFYFDADTDTSAHNLFVIQDDATVEYLGAAQPCRFRTGPCCMSPALSWF
jgi:hypothetical protein